MNGTGNSPNRQHGQTDRHTPRGRRFWWQQDRSATSFESSDFGERIVFRASPRVRLLQLGLITGSGTESSEVRADGLENFAAGLPSSGRPFPNYYVPNDDMPPEAAQWLFERRVAHEMAGRLTSHAWCTHCGGYFVSGRVKNWVPGRPAVQPRCPAHANKRPRPQLRECAAPDCDEWFVPTNSTNVHCGKRCGQADYERRQRPA